MTPDQLLRAWFENVWNQRNDDFVHQHMGCPCAIEGLPEHACNPAGFIEFRNNLLAAISEMKVEVIEGMGDEERAMGVCRVTGTHSSTGVAVDFRFAYTARVKGDQIMEARNVIDFLTMLQQTNLLSEEVLGKALTP